jgi:hypothetical protein
VDVCLEAPVLDGIICILACDPGGYGLQPRAVPTAKNTECLFVPICMHPDETSI